MWGDLAADPAWRLASVPTGRYEAFGVEDVVVAELLAELDSDLSSPDRVLTDIATRSLIDAVDLLWAVAGFETDDEATAAELADASRAATKLARNEAAPSWVAEARDDRDLLYRLTQALPAEEGPEAFGANRVGARLAEALDRVAGTANKVGSRVALSALRAPLTRSVSTFLGDVLVYLNTRGDPDTEGPIVSAVSTALEDTAAARKDDDPMVVVAHSMGGNIVYDILSRFRPQVHCDVLLTVGSQVGLFAELEAFPSIERPANPSADRVPLLANVGRWINVFDRNDVLGYATSGIFDGAEDFAYDTGKGLLRAHSSYFIRPSFYDRMAARLGGDG